MKRVATMNTIEVEVRKGDVVCGYSISPVGGMDRTVGVGGWVRRPPDVSREEKQSDV